jgi:hypothetical protein
MNGVSGRPPVLTDQEQQWVYFLIQERFSQRAPITCSAILNEIELEFGKGILPNTPWHMIAHVPWCKTVCGIPMEASRVAPSEEVIDEYYALVEHLPPDAPCDVIYNIDEVGFDE